MYVEWRQRYRRSCPWWRRRFEDYISCSLCNIYTAQFRVFNSYWYLNYISSLLVLIWWPVWWYTGFMKRIEFFSLLLWCWFIWSSRYMTKWAIKGWLLKLHIGNSYFSFTCFLPYIRAFNAYIGYIFIYWHICICGRGCRSNAKIYIIHHLKKTS